jgi:hypothetical protein
MHAARNGHGRRPDTAGGIHLRGWAGGGRARFIAFDLADIQAGGHGVASLTQTVLFWRQALCARYEDRPEMAGNGIFGLVPRQGK